MFIQIRRKIEKIDILLQIKDDHKKKILSLIFKYIWNQGNTFLIERRGGMNIFPIPYKIQQETKVTTVRIAGKL